MSKEHQPLVSLSFGIFAVIASAAVSHGQSRIEFGSSGLIATETNASIEKSLGRNTVTYYITNESNRSFRLFLQERPRANDNLGNSWEAYNTSDVVGVWTCRRKDGCLTKELENVEANSTLILPGDVINLVVPMVLKGSVPKRFGDVVALGLMAHIQEVSTGANGIIEGIGPWHTISLGLPNIPVTVSQ